MASRSVKATPIDNPLRMPVVLGPDGRPTTSLPAFRNNIIKFRNGQLALNAYKDAETTRFNEPWRGTRGSADADLSKRMELVYKSRYVTSSSPIGGGILHTFASNVIGTGIRVEANLDAEALGITEDKAEELNKLINAAWEDWSRHSDYGSNPNLNFSRQQWLEYCQRFVCGESIIIPRWKRRPGTFWRFCLQFVETDRLSTPAGKKFGENVRDGVSFTDDGDEDGMYILKRHPGDLWFYRKEGINEYDFLPKWNYRTGMLNYWRNYHPLRPDQTHGVPKLHSGLDMIGSIEDHMYNESVKANISSMYSMFIKTPNPHQLAGEMGEDYYKAIFGDGYQRLQDLYPGMIAYLFPGEEIVEFSPENPSNNFSEFIKKRLQFVGAGVGLPIELVLRDFGESNYGGSRAAILETRRGFEIEQHFEIHSFIQPVRELFLDEMYLQGLLPVNDYEENRHLYAESIYLTPGWQWIKEKEEAEAAVTKLANNLTTLADEWGGKGRNWKTVLQQKSKEIKYAKELGIELVPPKAKKPSDLPNMNNGSDKEEGKDDAETESDTSSDGTDSGSETGE